MTTKTQLQRTKTWRGVWIGIVAGLAAWCAGGAAGEGGPARMGMSLEMREGAAVVGFESRTGLFHRVFSAGQLAGEGNWCLTNVLGGVEGWQSWTDAAPGQVGFYKVEGLGWNSPVDSDGDGLPDVWEMRHKGDGFNPLDSADGEADADGDGLANGQEYWANTDWQNPDTDGDGLPDGWEVEFGLLPLDPGDRERDEDVDGLTNLQEFESRTDPRNADTDGDGLPDGWEVEYGLNPLDATDGEADADNDGLTNAEEYMFGTLSNDPDCDGDGLNDGEERDAGTDPWNPDTDSDGLPDGWEAHNGLNPLSDGGMDYGLVAWWTFDEGQGGIVSNRACGGKKWNGELRGMQGSDWTDGRNGGALRFNGQRQYVSVSETNGDGTVLDGGPFTVTWVCKYEAEGAPANAALGGATASATKGWRVRFEREGAPLTYSVGNGTEVKSATLTNAAGLSDWTDVALTWDGTRARGYVNGNAVLDGERTVVMADAGSGKILIGACELNLASSYWKGWIDDVRIYRKALTEEELGLVNDWLGDTDGDGLANGDEFKLGTHPLMADTDGDGLPDKWEVEHDGFVPLDGTDGAADWDEDGLTNAQEYQNHTLWDNADTDGDGMPDGWEVANGLNPLEDDAAGDADGDGATNLEEYAAGTNPQVPETAEEDTDGDGMPDAWEVAIGLDPQVDDAAEDLDADGLTNYEEYVSGTDPWKQDTDGDGLDDGKEVMELHTNPSSVDTDGDGLDDRWEVMNGLNPLSDGGTAYGLAAWWKMDGNLQNAAGAAWPGRLRGPGEPVWGLGRGAGTALRFDGQGVYVSVSETNEAGKIVDGGPFTVTWVCKYEAEGAPAHAALGGAMATARAGWLVRFEGAGKPLMYSVGDGTGAKSATLVDAAGLADWTDVALTWDGEKARGYVNGKAVFDGERPVVMSDAGREEVLIGACELNLASSFWKGWIDDARIYRKALSEEELGVVNDWLGDPDGDGLTNGDEYRLGTHPQSSDTDDDGMPDGWEVANGLNPLEDDSAGDADGDGATNLEEYAAGTDPQVPETAEVDTDGDGMPDAWEVANGLNPQANDAAKDPDADGLTNYEEYVSGTDPQSPDTDGDGVGDGEEVAYGLNPLCADTDADGLDDGWEVYNGTDPLSGMHAGLKPLVWLTFDEGEPEEEAFIENRADKRFAAQLQGRAEKDQGVRGGALRLDGSNWLIVNQPEPGMLLGTNGYTVSMWICSEAVSNAFPTVFSDFDWWQEGDGQYEGRGVAVRETTNNTLQLAEGFPGVGVKVANAELWRERWQGKWTHLAVVHDGEMLRMYLNGSFYGEIAGVPTATAHKSMYLGRGHVNWTQSAWKGAIDDVRVFGRALAREEIATLVEAESDSDLTGTSNLAKANGGRNLMVQAAEPSTEGSLDMTVLLGEVPPEGVHWLARYDGLNPGSEAEVFLWGDRLHFELHDAEGASHSILIPGVTSNGYLVAGTNRVTASWRGFDGTVHGADLRLYLNGVDVMADGIWQGGSTTPKLARSDRSQGVGYQEGAWTEGTWGEGTLGGRACFGRRNGQDAAETGAVKVVSGTWRGTAYGIPGTPEVPGGAATEKSVCVQRAEEEDPRVLAQDMARPGTPAEYVDEDEIDVMVKRCRQFTDSLVYVPLWMRGENPASCWAVEAECLGLILAKGASNGVGIALGGHSMWEKMVCISNQPARAAEFVRVKTNGTELVLSLEPAMVKTSGENGLAKLADKADRTELEKYQDNWARALSDYQGYEYYFLDETALTGIDGRAWDAATYSEGGLEWFREYTAGKYGAEYAEIKFPLPALPSMLTVEWEGKTIRVEGALAERAEPTRDPDIWAKWWEWREVVFATEIGGYGRRLAELNAENPNWRGMVLFVSPILAFTHRSGLDMAQLAKVKGLDWLVMENTRLHGYGSTPEDLEEEVRLQLEAAKTASDRGGTGFGSYVMVHAYPYPQVNGETTAVYRSEWVANDVDLAQAFQSKMVVPYSAAMLMDRPGYTAPWQNTHYEPEAEQQWLTLRYTKLRSPPAGLAAERLATQVRLSWNPVDGAEEYEVQVARDGDFLDIVETAVVAGDAVQTLVGEEDLQGAVSWRVRAVYAKRSYSDGGEETEARRYFGYWSAAQAI